MTALFRDSILKDAIRSPTVACDLVEDHIVIRARARFQVLSKIVNRARMK